MQKRNIFLLLVVLAISFSVMAFALATRATSSSVLVPSELAKVYANDKSLLLERVRLAGQVTAEPFEYQVEPEITLRFKVADREDPKALTESKENESKEVVAPIAIIYDGLKPDMFAAGRDVLIDGDFRDGVLHAHTLLTQCPSKYEPPDPGKDDAAPTMGALTTG